MAHPEAAGLIGYDPVTALITLSIVVGQVAIAGFLGHLGLGYWWLALIVAFGIGAFANHALFVIIHDACHNAILKKPVWNKWVGILADLPNTVPTAMGFRYYHIKHHSHLGDYDYDADLPSHWEARTFGHSWYGKAAWMFFFAAFQLARLGRLRGTVPMWGRWTFINAVCVILFDIAVLVLARPQCAALSLRLLLVFGRRAASARRALGAGAFHERSVAGDLRLLWAAEHSRAQYRLS